ncbi:hypothetical protein CI109_105528 [Kwoniella shandongensis]|uniref:Uncharacterized protein n=1 Tax=Kwoniella shandongensis TaxID=1734106 RepID=A0A5M6C2K4_9TREE|nr:uncharacterized protein CI109_002249 [Kwoniella shandongensis]KAA5529356.1 hypothetical protein CI109_002249 [Kwoniella shandongensis]
MLRPQQGAAGNPVIKQPGAYDLFPPPKVSSWLDDLQSKIQRGLNPPESPGPSRSPSPIIVDEKQEIDDVYQGVGELAEQQQQQEQSDQDTSEGRLEYDLPEDEDEDEDEDEGDQLGVHVGEEEEEEEEQEQVEGERQQQVRVPLPSEPIELLSDGDEDEDEEEEEEEEEGEEEDQTQDQRKSFFGSDDEELQQDEEDDQLFGDGQADYEPGYGIVPEEDGQAYVGSDGDVYAEEEDDIFDDDNEDDDEDDDGDKDEEEEQEEQEEQEESEDGIEYVGTSESPARSSQPPASENVYPPLPQFLPLPVDTILDPASIAGDEQNLQIQPFSEDFIDPTLLADLVQHVHQGVPPQAAGPSTFAHALPTDDVLQHQGGQYEDGAYDEDEMYDDEESELDEQGFYDQLEFEARSSNRSVYSDDEDELEDESEVPHPPQPVPTSIAAKPPAASDEVIEIGSSSDEDDREEDEDDEGDGSGDVDEEDDEDDEVDEDEEEEEVEESEEAEQGQQTVSVERAGSAAVEDENDENEQADEEEEEEVIEVRQAELQSLLEQTEAEEDTEQSSATVEIQVETIEQVQEVELPPNPAGIDETMQVDDVEIVEIIERDENAAIELERGQIPTSIETSTAGVVSEIQDFISQLVEQQVEESEQAALALSEGQTTQQPVEITDTAPQEAAEDRNEPADGISPSVLDVPGDSLAADSTPTSQEEAAEPLHEPAIPMVVDSFTMNVEENAPSTKNQGAEEQPRVSAPALDLDVEMTAPESTPADALRESEEPTPSPVIRPSHSRQQDLINGEDFVSFDSLETPEPTDQKHPVEFPDQIGPTEPVLVDMAATIAESLPTVEDSSSTDIGPSDGAGTVTLEAPLQKLSASPLSTSDTPDITPTITQPLTQQFELAPPSFPVELPSQVERGDLSPASFSPLQTPAALADTQVSPLETEIQVGHDKPLPSAPTIGEERLPQDTPSLVISGPDSPPTLPDPYLPPPNSTNDLPIDIHDVVPKVNVSPSLIVEAPSNPVPQDVPAFAPSRPETPTELPDPRLSPPDTTAVSPLDPHNFVPRPVTSPSLIVEPPADPQPVELLSTPISRAETPVELPDPTVPPVDAFLEAPITPHTMEPAPRPRTPSLEVEPPLEASVESIIETAAAPAQDTSGLLIIDDDVEEDVQEELHESVVYGTETAPVEIEQTGLEDTVDVDREVSMAPTEPDQHDVEMTEVTEAAAETQEATIPTRPALQMTESAIERLRHHHGSPGAVAPPVAAVPVRKTRSRTQASASPVPPPVTRSHCYYEKLRISDDELTAVVLAPHCTLSNTEQMLEEEARVEGVPTAGEELEAREYMISHDNPILQPRLATKLRRIVGAQIFDEGCCYVLYAKADAKLSPADTSDTPRTIGHRKRKSVSAAPENSTKDEEDEIVVEIHTPVKSRAAPAAHATRSATRRGTASVEPEVHVSVTPARRTPRPSSARKGKGRETSLVSERSATGSPGPTLRRSARKSAAAPISEGSFEGASPVPEAREQEEEEEAEAQSATGSSSAQADETTQELRTPRRSGRKSLKATATPEPTEATPRRATRQTIAKSEEPTETSMGADLGIPITTPISATRSRARKALTLASKEDEAPYRPNEEEDEEGTPSPVEAVTKDAPSSSKKRKGRSSTVEEELPVVEENQEEDVEMEESEQLEGEDEARSTRRKRKTNDVEKDDRVDETPAETISVRETRGMKRRAVENKDVPGTPVREETKDEEKVEADAKAPPAEAEASGLRRSDSWGGRLLKRFRFGKGK